MAKTAVKLETAKGVGINFIVPIVAVPYARTGGHGKVRFTPPRQRAYIGEIRFFAEKAMAGRDPISGALKLTVVFVYVRPASWPKRKQNIFWKESKPDLSNNIKLVEDSLNGCVYLDDAQIAEISAQKIYGDRPEVRIEVSPLDSP